MLPEPVDGPEDRKQYGKNSGDGVTGRAPFLPDAAMLKAMTEECERFKSAQLQDYEDAVM